MLRRVRVASTNQKISAIKLLRELSGLGLKDSKDLVEAAAFVEIDRDDATLARIAEEGRRCEVAFEFDPPLRGGASASSASFSSSSPSASGEFSLRYHSGPNKIPAIKLVRELSGLGLKEAKDVVELAGVIRQGLSSSEAESIIARFTEIGSRVELVRGSSTPTPSLPSPRAGAERVYGYVSEDDDF